MTMQLVTGNHAAGHSLGLAGEANRTARGSVCGIYPITPQTYPWRANTVPWGSALALP